MTVVWVHGTDFRVLPDRVPPVARLSLRELRAIRDAQEGVRREHLTLVRGEVPGPVGAMRLDVAPHELVEHGLRVNPFHPEPPTRPAA